jgi:ribosomal protein S20
LNLHGNTTRRSTAMMLCLGLTWGVSGCHKRVLAPQLPPIMSPVDLATAPEPEQPPMVEEPKVQLPPPPIASAAAKPKRKRPAVAKAPATSPPEPVQSASADPAPEVAAIGALTAGGDTNPRTHQEAADLIGSNDKRLNALSAQIVEEQKTQISKVRNFQRQAQEALSSGDAEGAKTLATKAKLLLDDLVK